MAKQMELEAWLARCKLRTWLHMGTAAAIALFAIWLNSELADAAMLIQASTTLDQLLPWILALLAAWYIGAWLAWLSMYKLPDWWVERWARQSGY